MMIEAYDDALVDAFQLGPMTSVCEYCEALMFEEERVGRDGHFNICCANGKLRNLWERGEGAPQCPEPLHNLVTQKTKRAKDFQQKIRCYNSALSFISFGANLELPPGTSASGPPVCILHGALYHYSYALEAEDDAQPKFAQLYMYDHAEAQRLRLDFWNDIDPKTLADLSGMLEDCSPFIERYRQMRDLADEFLTEGRGNVKLGFAAATDCDMRRYNHPTKEEVAAVFIAEDGAPPGRRDMVLWPRAHDEPVHRVDDSNEHVDPCTYVLLFPRGDLGWHYYLKHDNRHATEKYTRVTPMQFYASKLMVRVAFGPLPHAGRFLFQQYIVDSYCKAEASRLQYLREHQTELRADSYKCVQDYVEGLDTGGSAYRIGRRVILPSSYAGSPRSCQQNYLDAMAIVRKTGKPDYFITMTANPQWEEVLENLGPGQHPHDRPDLIARVFQLKWKQLLKEVLDDGVLGSVLAYCWCIEFQKRGLPHGHLLVTLRPHDKVKDVADIDARVCAEFPPNAATTQKELFKVISTGMVHGPCGTRNSNAPCTQADGSCSKGYPKVFLESTQFTAGAYPLYRRRCTDQSHMKNGVALDNRDVVPYNAYLARRFRCHINVEIVTSLKSVKYLFKYVHKGHDRASLEFKYNNDEIHAHVDARYVGPAEACWRLFGFPLHGMSHHVERLAVHLRGHQSIIFAEGQERASLEQAAGKKSTLEAWFDFNKDNPDRRHVRYIDMPLHCVWEKKNSRWQQRKQRVHKVIGRLCGASPNDPERYYLYLLLLHTPGAQAWEDLRRVPGQEELAPTLQDAARQRGLVDDVDELRLSMVDAKEWRMPTQLRQFFANILINGGGGVDAGSLWEEFADSMAEDYARTKPTEVARDLALQDIQMTLEKQGKKNSDFDGLPDPIQFDRELWLNADLQAELNFDTEKERERASDHRSKMYPAQAEAFDAIANALHAEKPAIFFLDGPGGTGKSFLFEALIHHARGQGKLAIACAWSGIAAALLPNGRTVSSRFGLPVPLPEENAQSSLTSQQARGRLLKAAHIILWDEVSMTPLEALDAADRCLQDISESDQPFGGKVLVMAGDFRQVLPVLPHANEEKIKAHAVTRHSYFRNGLVQRHSLAYNMRASKDPAYSNFLLELGDGRLPVCKAVGPQSVRLPDEVLASETWEYDHLARWVFGAVVAVGLDCAKSVTAPSTDDLRPLSSRAVLAPKNAVVHAFNDHVLSCFPPEQIVEYLSTDRIGGGLDEEYANYPVEFLNSVELSGLPPHILRLCPGAVIILIRNLNSNLGLCNGIRAVVIACSTRCLDVLILTGKCASQRFFLPRIPMSSQPGALPFSLIRRQYPVKLAWAMSINKAQGQSLERVGLLLHESVFAHGQLYVAASRAGGFDNIRVLVETTETQGSREEADGISEGTYTNNVVYRDILVGNTPLPQDDSIGDGQNVDTDTLGRSRPHLPRRHTNKEDIASRLAASTLATQTETDETQQPFQIDLGTDNAVAMMEAAGGPQDRDYPGYFERQRQARCGLHALNNALGFDFLTAEDMTRACDVHLAEMALEQNPETRDMHENMNGWYSEAVMAQALRVKGNIYKLNVDSPLLPTIDNLMRIFADNVQGVVVNLDQWHWVAFQIVAEDIWLLDSLKEPLLMSFDDLLHYVEEEHSYAFLVECIVA